MAAAAGATLVVKSISGPQLAYTDLGYVSNGSSSSSSYEGQILLVNGRLYVRVATRPDVAEGTIELSMFQRASADVVLDQAVTVEQVTLEATTSATAFGTVKLRVETLVRGSGVPAVSLEASLLRKAFHKTFGSHILVANQLTCMELPTGVQLRLTVLDIEPAPYILCTPLTTVLLESSKSVKVVKDGSSSSRTNGGAGAAATAASASAPMFEKGFSFEKLGIGGLDKEFSEIFRRAFASRMYPALMKELGMAHVRGMLLYGPPGCGKSLIAKKVGQALGSVEPKVVNGPEILNKYVGESEANIRDLFAEAEEDEAANGDASQLHIIILDEIDAICRQRGSGTDGTGVRDSVVNQLLSKIQGVNALNNILLIGMTNRKELIDDALLRPGRLELHVEIGLPDEAGRLSILNIHTHLFRPRRLAADIDLAELAAQTKNYTGAELEGLVKSALSYALGRIQDKEDIGKPGDASAVCLSMADFKRALLDLTPAFGSSDADFDACTPGSQVAFSAELVAAQKTLGTFVAQVAGNRRTPILSVLVHGVPGSGKSALVARTALAAKFPFRKLLSPEAFVGMSESQRLGALHRAFEDAYKSPLAMLVLDDVERFLGANAPPPP